MTESNINRIAAELRQIEVNLYVIALAWRDYLMQEYDIDRDAAEARVNVKMNTILRKHTEGLRGFNEIKRNG